VEEDAEERGLEPGTRLAGATPVRCPQLPELFAAYDQVWHL